MDNSTKPSTPAPSGGHSAVRSQFALRKVDWGGWSRLTALLASVPAAGLAALWSPAVVWAQPRPGLTLSADTAATLVEGDSGKQRVRLTASLPRPATEVVTPSFSIDHTGAPNLHVGHCGNLSWAPEADICMNHRPADIQPGQSSVQWDFYVLGDSRSEGDETVEVTLWALKAADRSVYLNYAPATISIVIKDDDAAPVLDDIENVTVRPGQEVDITAAATDADGDTVSYTWKRKADEKTPALPGQTELNQARLTFTPPMAGAYTMTVTADDGHGNTDTEDVTITVTSPPSAPLHFQGIQGNKQAKLQWMRSRDSRITKYQYQQNDGQWKDIPGSGQATTSHTVTGLTNNTAYRFKVRAMAGAAQGVPSNEVSVTPAGVVPPTLTVTLKNAPSCANTPPCNDLDFYEAQVKWTVEDTNIQAMLENVPLLSRFHEWKLQWRLRSMSGEPGGGWADYSNYSDYSNDSGWIDNKNSRSSPPILFRLQNGHQLEFRLRAEGSKGLGTPAYGPWSNTASVTAQSRYTPLAPKGFKASGGNRKVRLTWNNLGNAHISKYQYQQNGNGKWVDIPGSSASTTSHTVTGLTNDTPHRFKVRAVASTLDGGASNEVSATPKAPVAPRLTVTTRKESDGVYAADLAWTVADEDPHAIVESAETIVSWGVQYRPKGTNQKWRGYRLTESNAATRRHTHVVRQATDMEYQVRAWGHQRVSVAVEDFMSGPWSNTVTASFIEAEKPGSPTGFQATAEEEKVRLAWNDPNNALISKYQYQQDDGTWMDVPDSSATTTSYTVTKLTNYTTYRFKIRAVVQLAGNTLAGDASNEVSATPPPLTLSMPAAVQVTEGTDSNAVVTVTASKALGDTFRFQLAWRDLTATSHSELHHDLNLRHDHEGNQHQDNHDYDDVPLGSTIFSFGPADTSKEIPIPITDDGLVEDNETFMVELSLVDPLPIGASLGNLRTVVTIVDDDNVPVLRDMEAVSVAKSQTVEVTATATDLDGDTLTYTWSRAGATPGDGNYGCYQYIRNGQGRSPTDLSSPRLRFTASEPGPCNMKVTVNDGHGNTDSKIVEITVTDDEPPEQPTGLSAEATGQEEVTLLWDDPRDPSITGYELRQKVMDNGGVMNDWIPIPGSDAETVSHTVSGLVGGKTYRYRIRALKGAAYSKASKRADATALARGTLQESAQTVPPSPSIQVSSGKKIKFCKVDDDECNSTNYESRGKNRMAWALDFALDSGENLDYNPTGLQIQWLGTDHPEDVSEWIDTDWCPRDLTYSCDGPTDVPWPGMIDNSRAHYLGRIVYEPFPYEISIRVRLVNEFGEGHASQWITFKGEEKGSKTYHSHSEGAEISVSNPTVQEAADQPLRFRVKLDRSRSQRVQSGPIRVKYATRDVTAMADDDYTATSGYVTFEPGETKKVVEVPVLDDTHDEASETMELVISEIGNPWSTPIHLLDVKGTGTIVNTDPMPAAWLGRFGRTVADHALDAVAKRIAAEQTPGLSGSLAGQSLPHTNFGSGGKEGEVVSDATGSEAAALAETIYHAATASGSMSGQDMLLGTNFSLARAADATGGNLSFWGRAAYSGFDGKEENVSLDGEVFTGLLGMDYARQSWMLGLAVSRSGGNGTYSGSDAASSSSDAGKIETTLTSAIPYGSWQASERLKLWGALGYGRGEMTLKPKEQDEIKADLNWTMAAVGARAALLDPDGQGLSLGLTSDALWTRTKSDEVDKPNLAASEAEVSRLRLGLEGNWHNLLQGGGELTPRFSLGARYDGGDAETGFGMELGGGMAWSSPGVGLSLDLDGRTLLFHEADGLRDWGFSAGLTFDPDPATKRGLSLTLNQDWGGAATGGLDALFAANPLEQRTGAESTSRWTLEAAYGLPVFSGHFTGSPYLGLALAARGRDYTVGWRLTPAADGVEDLSVEVKATRSESDNGWPDHGVGLELQRTW